MRQWASLALLIGAGTADLENRVKRLEVALGFDRFDWDEESMGEFLGGAVFVDLPAFAGADPDCLAIIAIPILIIIPISVAGSTSSM